MSNILMYHVSIKKKKKKFYMYHAQKNMPKRNVHDNRISIFK